MVDLASVQSGSYETESEDYEEDESDLGLQDLLDRYNIGYNPEYCFKLRKRWQALLTILNIAIPKRKISVLYSLCLDIRQLHITFTFACSWRKLTFGQNVCFGRRGQYTTYSVRPIYSVVANESSGGICSCR